MATQEAALRVENRRAIQDGVSESPEIGRTEAGTESNTVIEDLLKAHTEATAVADPRGERIGAELRKQGLEKLRAALQSFNLRAQWDLLQIVMEERKSPIKAADELAHMEPEVWAVVKSLPLRTRAMFGILMELAAVEGESVGADYGAEILDSLRRDDDMIRAGCTQLAADPDMRILGRVHALAAQIIDPEEAGTYQEPEDVTTAPAPTAATATQAHADRRLSLDKARGELRPVVEWLLQRTLPEKLTAVLTNELLKHETEIHQQGLYAGEIGQDIINDLEDDIGTAAESRTAIGAGETVALNFAMKMKPRFGTW